MTTRLIDGAAKGADVRREVTEEAAALKEAVQVAGAITPVPGGVGPVTIAMLVANTLDAFKLQHGLA